MTKRQGRTIENLDPYTIAVPEAEQTAVSNLIVDGKEWLFLLQVTPRTSALSS